MPISVIHDNDGHVDDLLSSLLLWLAPEIDLQAVTITNGDCYADQSFEALVKMATYLDLEGAEIAFNEDEVPNQFPDNWRRESYIMNELPLFAENSLKKQYQGQRARRSETLMIDCLNNSKTPVTFATTGPLTNVARVLHDRPDLKKKVSEVVIMGGALNVAGNVEEQTHDGSAEWNFYADPLSAKFIFDSGIPIRLIPLDVTNQLPVSKDFISKLDEQSDKCKASMMAVKLWSLVKGFEYYFWDTAAAAAIIAPELFTFKEMRIEVSTNGRSQGKLSTSMFGGRKIKVAVSVQRAGFEQLLLRIFSSK